MFSSFIPEDKRWNVAFSLAAIVMVVSLVNFIFTQRRLEPIGLQPQTLNADGTFHLWQNGKNMEFMSFLWFFCTNNYDDGF